MAQQQAVDYDALAQSLGGSLEAPATRVPDSVASSAPDDGVDYDALASEFGGSALQRPDIRSENEKDAEGNALVRDEHPHARTARLASEFLSGVWRNVNPVEAAKSLVGAFTDPGGTIQGIGEAQGALAVKAKEAFDRGDYATGLRHSLHYLLPLIGPGLDAAADKMVAGEYAEGAGEAVGIGAGLVSPKLVPRSVKVPGPVASRLNPQESAAVAFGEARGVPIDAATMSGRPSARAMQKRVANSMGGEGTAERMIGAQEEALTRVSGDLANDAHPSIVTPQQSGEGIRQSMATTMTQLNDAAHTAYDALRAAEADPKHVTKIVLKPEIAKVTSDGRRAVLQPEVSESMGLAVDISDTKAALKPLYEREMAAAKIAQPQGARARGVQALDRLMRAPDHAPLSVVDDALSDLKALMRKSGPPEAHTEGQFISGQIVQQLDAKVRARAAQAGPDVMKALTEGRAATKQKYAVAEVFEGLNNEPVKTMQSLVAPGDSAIMKLKAVAKVAPEEVPKIGRAYLEDLFTTATSEGRFGHVNKLHAEWQKLGSETKQILFRKPELIRDLDHFFALAKKVSENPNPSGTAHTMTVLNVASQPGMWALAKLLYTPRGARALTRGLQIGGAPKAAQAAAIAEIVNAAREAGVPLEFPKAAEDQRPTAGRPPQGSPK